MQETRVFRVKSPLRHLVPALVTCAVVLVIVFFAMAADGDDLWILGIIAGVMGIGLGLGLWLTTRTRLEIAPQHIVYHGAGYRVRSTWANIIGCEKRVLGASDIECLILRESGMEMGFWMSIGSFLAAFQGNFDSIQQQANQIPVGMFDANWRSGEIGQLVAQYAPDALKG